MTEPAQDPPGRAGAGDSPRYALQGVVVAYLVNYNKKYMIRGGVDERTAGLVETAVLMTLVFKFLLGPLSDRFNPLGLGHRRPFIVLGLVMQSLGLIGLTVVHPGEHLARICRDGVPGRRRPGALRHLLRRDGRRRDAARGPGPRPGAAAGGRGSWRRWAARSLFGLWMTEDRHRAGPERRRALGLRGARAAAAGPGARSSASGGRHRRSRRSTGRRSRCLARPEALVLLAFGALYGIIGLGVEFNLSRYYDSLGTSTRTAWAGSAPCGTAAGRPGRCSCRPEARLGRGGELTVGIVAPGRDDGGAGPGRRARSRPAPGRSSSAWPTAGTTPSSASWRWRPPTRGWRPRRSRSSWPSRT